MNAKTTDSYSINVKNEIIKRSLLGFPLGIAIGTVIALFYSFLAGDGAFHPVSPAMLVWMPSEIVATFWQTVLCGIFGAVSAGSSPIFQIERWSLAKQTIVHFLLISLTTILVASICGWANPYGFNLWSIFVYMGIFVLIYLIIWMSMYMFWKNWIKRVNNKLG